MSQVSLSLLVPAFNKEDFIECALIALDNVVKSNVLKYEIVVVDDGSNDKTLEKAIDSSKKHCHVKVLSYQKNMGKGYAVKTGFMKTTGKVVVFTDSYMEIDLSTMSTYLEVLDHGDVVIASKWHPHSVVKIPLTRRALSQWVQRFSSNSHWTFA